MLVFGQLTALKPCELVWAAHVPPPFVVARMMPPPPNVPPTAKHVLALGQPIPERFNVDPEFWRTHALPALVVATIVPPSPTAKQMPALGQLTLFRSCVVGEV